MFVVLFTVSLSCVTKQKTKNCVLINHGNAKYKVRDAVISAWSYHNDRVHDSRIHFKRKCLWSVCLSLTFFFFSFSPTLGLFIQIFHRPQLIRLIQLVRVFVGFCLSSSSNQKNLHSLQNTVVIEVFKRNFIFVCRFRNKKKKNKTKTIFN